MFSTVTSVFFNSSRTISRPRGDFRFNVSDFLLALNWWKYQGSSSGWPGRRRRPGSPSPGFSILTTSAPSQASASVEEGPASNWVKSTTRMPARQSSSTPLPSIVRSSAGKMPNRTISLRLDVCIPIAAASAFGEIAPAQRERGMPIISRIAEFHAELAGWRRDIHAHPELGFEEHRTADLVAQKLAEFGILVHRGIGRTGVVGELRNGNSPRTIGLRADMDALPILEANQFPYRSQNDGRMHACGHDGHTTMLLGAARYLAETRDFDGTIHFIFQPAEEGLGGARAMLADGLFSKFPCDEIYGLHNAPDLNHGEIAILPGPAMAGADFFDITIRGYGAHGAMPERSKDPVVIAMALGQALQTIVSRNVGPTDAAVLSITQIHAGSAYNVIPGEAKLAGTVRAFSDEVRALIRERMRAICAGIAAAFQVEIDVDIRDIFSVLVNQEEHSKVIAEVARTVVDPA